MASEEVSTNEVEVVISGTEETEAELKEKETSKGLQNGSKVNG